MSSVLGLPHPEDVTPAESVTITTTEFTHVRVLVWDAFPHNLMQTNLSNEYLPAVRIATSGMGWLIYTH